MVQAMKKINPNDIKIIEGLPPFTEDDDRIAMDTEFFGMDITKMHRPHGTFASLACTMDGKTVYIITDPSDILAFFERVEKGVHIWHNAKFDITQMRRFAAYPDRDRIWDTMLIEQIMYSGYFNDFSLKDLARRHLDIYLEKDTRDEFEDADTMTPEMLMYAAIDVVVTWLVFQAQKRIISKEDLNIWRKIDRGALWAVMDMDGMVMDKDAWTALAGVELEQAKAIQERYPSINLNSPKHQVLPHLRKQSKKYRNYTSTGAEVLERIKDECEFAADVLNFRKHAKAASTYGINFLNDVESNGRIYSDFKINGAATGRLSSSRPNLENIPKDPRYRACFVAALGHVLVDADWSSQEPRIAAYLSQDERLIDIFVQKKDIYIEAARMMFGWELTKKDPRRASRMKPTVLGACYGLTEHGMEEQYGIPKDEGKELLAAFFSVFPQLKDWIDEQQSGHEYVTTIMGRKFWLNSYQDKSNRNAINSPVQGSAGDALKIAGYRLTRLLQGEFNRMTDYVYVVNFIHDETLVECDERLRSDVIDLVRQVKLDVAAEMHPGIPADVEVGWGHNWAEAHGG